MTCRIDRAFTPSGREILCVSGRIDCEHVEALLELTSKDKITKGLTIDLGDVTVVSRAAIEVLSRAEANGIELRSCPAYIREWVSRTRECGTAEVDHETLGD